MFETGISLVIGLAVGATLFSLILLITFLFGLVDDEDRTYMDPPPRFMLPIWPLVRLFSHFLGSNLPASYLDKTDDKLQKNGLSFVVSAEDYFSVCLVFAILLPLLGGAMLSSSGDVNPAILVIFSAMGFVLPEAWVKDSRRRRDIDIIQTLPIYLEYLSMCVDAGLNFAGALRQTVDKGPAGAMKNEFRIILRDINSGQTRADALRRMDARVGLKDVSVFISAVIQAERMGSSIKETLMVQAQQRLDERFYRAEKMAMEAPVKLVIPLIVFIFPLTFIILLFPIVIKFLEQGTL